jgi:hypothetical protein
MLRPYRPSSQLDAADDELRPVATAVHSSYGQKHDRIDKHHTAHIMAVTQLADGGGGGSGSGSEGAGGSNLYEITTGQRMASAMTGSLLTSLLGECRIPSAFHTGARG